MDRLNPEQLCCSHVKLQCSWDALPGKYLNLASSGGAGGLENSTKAGKKWSDHIDLHLAKKSQKVTVTVMGQVQGHVQNSR